MERKMIAAIGVLLAILLQVAEAQSPLSCISSLTTCAPFLGSSNPSRACCNALKTTVKNDLACLCSLLGNKDLIKQVNVTKALELPKLCNITTDANICDSVKTGPAPLASPPGVAPLASPPPGAAHLASPPPATPEGNGGHALPLSVVPALTALLLFFLTVALA